MSLTVSINSHLGYLILYLLTPDHASLYIQIFKRDRTQLNRHKNLTTDGDEDLECLLRTSYYKYTSTSAFIWGEPYFSHLNKDEIKYKDTGWTMEWHLINSRDNKWTINVTVGIWIVSHRFTCSNMWSPVAGLLWKAVELKADESLGPDFPWLAPLLFWALLWCNWLLPVATTTDSPSRWKTSKFVSQNTSPT